MNLSRRKFLKMSAGAAIASAVPVTAIAAPVLRPDKTAIDTGVIYAVGGMDYDGDTVSYVVGHDEHGNEIYHNYRSPVLDRSTPIKPIYPHGMSTQDVLRERAIDGLKKDMVAGDYILVMSNGEVVYLPS